MKIEEYMHIHKINAQNLATKAGLSFTTIYNVMCGKPLNLKSARKIVIATEGLVTYDDLMPKEVDKSEKEPNHKAGTTEN